MIPYGRHSIDEEDIQAVVEVLRGDWLTTGPMVERFEQALSACIGDTPCVAVSSGTAALHAAYVGAGLGPGDEVITPPITFVATQAALLHVGATPVFADVEPDTATINAEAVEAAIGSRTSAIVAVDYAGHPADMVALRALADKYKLLLIEDAAHSLGSSLRGHPVGSLADLTTFSFFPTKNITTGEGGAVASPNSEILSKVRRFARQGLVREPEKFLIKDEGPWHQEVHEVGLNYRLSDVQAALGLSQLSKLSTFKAQRAVIKAIYDDALWKLPGVDVPAQRSTADPVWHLYPLRAPSERRHDVFVRLRQEGIGVQVNYLPAYRHPALSRLADPRDFPHAESYYSREISLPLHPSLSGAEITRILEATTRAVEASL
jgi:UDP-4-amino-4,6-dideoxy-N-acetyl-beta-L-altrosamine transaminase